MVVIQYPHILKLDLVSGSTTETDANGDTVIVPGTTTTVEIKCRFEPNGTGQYLIGQDGLRLDFGWIVYQPLGQLEIPEGFEVKGYLGEKLIASGTIKRFSQGQLNARAWV
jgi:hypothetical protein